MKQSLSNLELAAVSGHLVQTEIRNEAAISVRGLSVSYGEKPVLFSVDVDFPAEQMCAIVGPNGAGKSTLLKSAMGIVPKLSGDVVIFGDDVKKGLSRIAYVPQRASIDWDFPVTVRDVVQMGLYRDVGLLGRLKSGHRMKIESCLDRVGMVDFMERQIGQLSGGQQQRVFLARALAQDADLYIFDEPFAGVDAATEKAIVSVLKSLKTEQKTVIAVHHDLATVSDYFDHVTLLNTRKIASGSIEETFTRDSLQKTYGGQLTTGQLDQFTANPAS